MKHVVREVCFSTGSWARASRWVDGVIGVGYAVDAGPELNALLLEILHGRCPVGDFGTDIVVVKMGWRRQCGAKVEVDHIMVVGNVEIAENLRGTWMVQYCTPTSRLAGPDVFRGLPSPSFLSMPPNLANADVGVLLASLSL